MTTKDQRTLVLAEIAVAVSAGARLERACAAVSIHPRTYNRWKAGNSIDRRKGAAKSVPRRYSDEERNQIAAVCCNDEYKDLTPYEIYVILLDKGTYLSSISTMYRVLRERGLVNFRGNTRSRTNTSRPPERVATGPNQVWAWDITYIKTSIAGMYHYLYTVIDVWSKKIVGWHISEVESYIVSEKLFKNLMLKYNLTNVYLHSDNGNPMKAGTMLATLYKLGIVPSFSRPRVSNDNAFIESFFKTLKYMKAYPKYFASLYDAQSWVADFINWYNEQHLHSSIGYVTPAQKHAGKATAIIAARNEIKRRAFEANPQRWSRDCSKLPDPQRVVVNPSLETLQAIAC